MSVKLIDLTGSAQVAEAMLLERRCQEQARRDDLHTKTQGLLRLVKKLQSQHDRQAEQVTEAQARIEQLSAHVKREWHPARSQHPTKRSQPAYDDDLSALSPSEREEYQRLVYQLENELEPGLAELDRDLRATQHRLTESQHRLTESDASLAALNGQNLSALVVAVEEGQAICSLTQQIAELQSQLEAKQTEHARALRSVVPLLRPDLERILSNKEKLNV